MEFAFETISDEEYARQRRSYDPLTDALRRLIDVGIHTEVDDDTVQAALTHLQSATATRAEPAATSAVCGTGSAIRRVVPAAVPASP